MLRPKGYRTITVEGQTWYWIASRGWISLVVRSAATGERFQADHQTIQRLFDEIGTGAWDDYHDRTIIEPMHVAAFIKDKLHWQPIKQ